MLYSKDNSYKIFNGNCLDVLKKMPDNFVDTIITDPPYGLSFMGKKWDYDVPSVEIWQECLRVLKHGGTALIFAGSRTQHRMAVNVEDAGFILKDCIMWLYGSGFPKATDISKQLDKGHERKVIGENPNYHSEGKRSGTGLNHYNENTKSFSNPDSAKNITEPATPEPATPEAKLWNGWKSHGLKPAYEPIIVAMKPNDGTYANNALKHGVSGLNIDGSRIPFVENDDNRIGKGYKHKAKAGLENGEHKDNQSGTHQTLHNQQGRYPANIILDEEAGKILDEQSGITTSSNAPRGGQGFHNSLDGPRLDGDIPKGHNDKGGASRFFYCAKASKKEKNVGCDEIGSNTHPTVKPLKLMEYLSTLTKTPTGGIVLDPFAGSGTTGVACKNTNRKIIMVEMDENYCKIIKNRMEDEN